MRDYTIYGQRDPRWSAQRLGTVNGSTLGAYGCYTTCFAMLACWGGHNVTPADLDNLFTDRGLYVSGNLCTDNILTKVYPDCQYQKTYNYASSLADLNLLKSLMADPLNNVILGLDFNHNPADGVQTHFVICQSFDGYTLVIADPWTGKVNNFSVLYGTNPAQTIQKFVVYRITPPAQPAPVVTVNPTPVQTVPAVDLSKYVTLEKYNSDMGSKQVEIDNLDKQLEQLRLEYSQALDDKEQALRERDDAQQKLSDCKNTPKPPKTVVKTSPSPILDTLLSLWRQFYGGTKK